MADDLRTFCSGIADAIRTKKGTSDTINAQKFAEEILSIEGGGSGDGAVIEYDAPGTVVPNTGTIEKVYVNTDLSESEVEALLSQLTYDSGGMCGVVGTGTIELMCLGMNGMYGIGNRNFNLIWCNEALFNQMGSQLGLTHSGWQDFTNPIEMNGEVLDAGSQNDLLTNLFSITPFEKATKTLSGTYDGSSIEADCDVDMAALIDEKKIPLNIKIKNDKQSITITTPLDELYCFPEGVNCPDMYYDGDWSEFSKYLLPYDEQVNFNAKILVFRRPGNKGLEIYNDENVNVIIKNITRPSILVLEVVNNNAFARIELMPE